jgi:predicted PurR-regulated permease PerM
VDVLLAWLVERLGRDAVNRTAKVMALVCTLATVVFVVVLLVLLAQ